MKKNEKSSILVKFAFFDSQDSYWKAALQ